VLGLEVVLADGTVLDMLRTLHKDNSGYPLKALFCGTEGTLGVITKCAVALVEHPQTTSVLLVKLRSFNDIPRLLSVAKTALSDSLTAFEFMDCHVSRLYFS
jgi:FAD/FMN-containing dehydrogenase